MNTVTVNASHNYSVLIGSDVLPQLGSVLANVKGNCKSVIISDTNVWPLYGKAVSESLLASGFEVSSFVFHAGEDSKNANTYVQILNFLSEKQLTRSDLLIALGGGVVGDITGFAAATYLRGISYVQVPTSLLAMVDSSVGGKTAIDLPAGKNLVGAFYQPILVLCDTNVLATLPANVFRDGCAEIIKYGILYDAELFSHLATNGLAFDRETVISRCVALKRDVVATDEFDTGDRQKLNLGHTIGHAVEAASQYAISHGQAVATGIGIISRSAYAHQLCSKETVLEIENVLCNFGLPGSTHFSAHELYENALSDKKRSGEFVNLIIPRAIGECFIHKTSVTELESFIKAGL